MLNLNMKIQYQRRVCKIETQNRSNLKVNEGEPK